MASCKYVAKPPPKTAQSEVVREAQAGGQAHARRIRVEFPGMHGEHRGTSGTVDLVDRPQDSARRAHAQAPSPPYRHDLAETITHEGWNFEDLSC